MIIFIDDDAACAAWLARRPQAAVIEGMRNRTAKRLVVHTAACPRFKILLRRNGATTHGRWAVCAPQRSELVAWCQSEYGVEPAECPSCAAAEPSSDGHHSTRLGRDVLDYVLDVAVIHLEPDARPYHLTVADVAQCLRKTPRQLAAALDRLIDDGLITVGAAKRPGSGSVDPRPIHPTAAALRTLEYYAACDPRCVEAEISKLHAA